MDEGFQLGRVAVERAISQVQTAVESLLDERSLVLPGSELDEELLEKSMLLALSHVRGFDEYTLCLCFGDRHDLLPVHP